MKKLFIHISFAVISAISISACEDVISNTITNESGDKTDVSMYVEPIEFDNSETKASVTSDETNGLYFKWSEDDAVGVYSTEGGFSRYALSKGAGMNEAVFNGQGFSLTPGNKYYAMYPYDGGKSNPSSVTVSYSSRSITGKDKVSDILGCDPLFASATASDAGGADFTFNHLSSFARFKCSVPQAGTFSKIEFLPMYDNITESGKYNISNNTWSPSASKSVTSVPITGISTTKSDNFNIWVPFAPQDLSSDEISAILKSSDNNIYSCKFNGKNLKSGKAYRIDLPFTKYTVDKSKSVTLTEKSQNVIDIDISGQYSGIAQVGTNKYAVIHDSKAGGGIIFLSFSISSTGEIGKITYEIPQGTVDGTGSRGPEGIAYISSSNTLFVAGENDQKILEYNLDGYPTGRGLEIPSDMSKNKIAGNAGFESLTYDSSTNLLWTTTESSISRDNEYTNNGKILLRLQSFDIETLKPGKRFLYLTDAPQKTQSSASIYAFGVSDMLALNDGKFLIMEREAYIPNGSVIDIATSTVVYIKIYEVRPYNDNGAILSKHLVSSFTYTSALNFSNYEGICLGPKIGTKQSIIMICDSQDRYKGLLQDKIKVMTIN